MRRILQIQLGVVRNAGKRRRQRLALAVWHRGSVVDRADVIRHLLLPHVLLDHFVPIARYRSSVVHSRMVITGRGRDVNGGGEGGDGLSVQRNARWQEHITARSKRCIADHEFNGVTTGCRVGVR